MPTEYLVFLINCDGLIMFMNCLVVIGLAYMISMLLRGTDSSAKALILTKVAELRVS